MIGSKKIDEVVGSLAWYYLVWKGKEAKEIISEYTSKCICTGGYFGMTAVVCSKAECALLRWFVNIVNTLLTKEVLKYIMGEVMICRGGRGSGAGGTYNKKLVTEYITNNTQWPVPTMINNTIKVILVGGGGGAGYNAKGWLWGGGGSGWLAEDYIENIEEGSIINITVGKAGSSPDYENNSYGNGGAGGVTSFGTYLSANSGKGGGTHNGGSGGAGGYGMNSGGIGYLWGGGYGMNNGGDGGTYGGGAAGANSGGNGGTYGGGGGAWYWYGTGGNGGTYGGGGASYNPGSGGTYGGNGGGSSANSSKLPSNGTNTIGWTNVYNIDGIYLTGMGRAGFEIGSPSYNSGNGGGGGGFGGNGGNSNTEWDNSSAGGGGGYGGNGGDAKHKNTSGGGGGFGGDGAHSNEGGGGGGYGKEAKGLYGGGGYRQKANNRGGGGAYGWGNGGDNYKGQQGICILQYYVKA